MTVTQMANHNVEDAAADWLMAEADGTCDTQARDAWLAADPQHGATYRRLARAWGMLDGLQDDPAMAAMRAQALEPVARRAPWWGIALAASLVAGMTGWWTLAQRDVAPMTYTSAHGQTRSLALADGSQIMLDADSAVSVTLSAGRRSISLDRGQAYFRVAHDTARPFVVTAGPRAVVALGTEFDVKRGAAQIAVALTQGRVRVGPADQAATMRPDRPGAGDELAVGQTLLFDTGTGATQITAAGATEAADWRAGRLHFDRTPLAQALADFNHYAPVPIQLADPHLASLPVSGVFRADNADGFVRALSLLFPIRVERRADRVMLSPAG